MTYTSGAYLKINQEGLKVSAIREEGFNERFKGDSGKEAFKKIAFKDINKYNTTVEDITPEYLVLPSTERIVNIGSDSTKYNTTPKKGLFCEKPALTINSDAYFFPLGSNGISLDYGSKARGFKLSEFLKGGTDELINSEFKGQTIQEVPLSGGYLCNEAFEKDADYDEKCFFNYEGAHIVSDSSKYNNLLKFGEDVNSFKIIKEEINLRAGDYLNYSCSNKREIYSIWSISIKNKDTGEDYTDFSIRNTSIVSNTPFTKDITLELEIHFHSAFRRRKGKNNTDPGIDWTGLYGYKLDEEDIVRDNFLQAIDAINIPAKTALDLGKADQFQKEINISEEGPYYISMYMRTTSPVQAKVKVCLLNAEGEEILFEPCICSDVQYLKDENSFVIIPAWRRISVLSNIQTTGTYKIKIDINAYINGATTPGLRVVGMMVSKGELPPYDYKNINYTNIPDKNLSQVKKHILYLDFAKASEVMSKENNWVVSYIRKFEGLGQDNQEHYDTIGNVTFGYKGEEIFVNNSSLTIENFSANTSYNGWEQVIISHTKGKDEILIEVTTIGNDSKSEAPRESKSYSFTTSITEYTLKMPHTKNGKYNLILGGKVEGTEIIRSNGSYRNLWWFPKGLSEKEMLRLKSQFLHYSQVERTKTDGSKEEAILIRGDFLQETTNY